MTTKTVNLYTFDELSDEAKEKARDWWRTCEAEDFGAHGDIYEPYETAAKILGVSFKQHEVGLCGGGKRQQSSIWWTLHVQGAGASFDGTYNYAKGSAKAIRAEFSQDKTLHAIADGLAAIQARYRYAITALIEANSRNGHFLSVELGLDSASAKAITDADDEAMRELFRDFARWIYEGIDAEYNARMEEDYADDAIRANEYTFLDTGKRED